MAGDPSVMAGDRCRPLGRFAPALSVTVKFFADYESPSDEAMKPARAPVSIRVHQKRDHIRGTSVILNSVSCPFQSEFCGGLSVAESVATNPACAVGTECAGGTRLHPDTAETRVSTDKNSKSTTPIRDD